jgi:hypothetical protein
VKFDSKSAPDYDWARRKKGSSRSAFEDSTLKNWLSDQHPSILELESSLTAVEVIQALFKHHDTEDVSAIKASIFAHLYIRLLKREQAGYEQFHSFETHLVQLRS